MADNVPPNVATELAPSGKLRAAINFGNSVLAQRDPAGGEPRGVSAELARELARRLRVPIEYVAFDAAGKVFDAVKTDAWDVAFLAIDPVRAAGIEFTGPYVVIEGAYVVPVEFAAADDRGRRPRRRARRRRSRERLRPLPYARAQARPAGARVERTAGARHVPQGPARSRSGREAADRRSSPRSMRTCA